VTERPCRRVDGRWLGLASVGLPRCVMVASAAGALIWVSACGSEDPTIAAPTQDAGQVQVQDAGQGVRSSGPISPEVAARFAILVGSCSPRVKAETILRYLYDDDGPSDLRAVATCTATKNTGCLALSECSGATFARTGANCPDRCDGNVWENCDDGVTARTDCSVVGQVCLTSESGTGARCSPSDAPACDAGSDVSWCGPDGRPHQCGRGNARDVRGPRCADLGLTCADGGCMGAEGACSTDLPPGPTITFFGRTCEGEKLKACVNGGITTFDCQKHIIGASCQLSSDPSTARCGLGNQCTVDTAAARVCDGDSAVICNRGRIDRIDCRALGFSGCLVLPADTEKVVCTPGVQ
jgi:hypothetical protein